MNEFCFLSIEIISSRPNPTFQFITENEYTEVSKLTNFGQSDSLQLGISSVWKLLKKKIKVLIPEIIANLLAFKCTSIIDNIIYSDYSTLPKKEALA